jgi:hypothetical protein
MLPLLQWKSNKYYILWVCVCSPRYTALHAGYLRLQTHPWPVQHYNIFPHYLINGTIFKKQLLTFFQNISHSKKNWRRYIKNVYLTSCKVPHYSSQILMTVEFCGQIFKKYSNIKFHSNPSSGSRFLTCRQTDSHDEANGHFLNFVNMLKKLSHGYHVIISQSINILS